MELFDTGPDLFASRRRRGRQTTPDLFGGQFLADERPGTTSVTPQERDSVLQDIGALTGGTVSRIADTLALPGDLIRGGLSGERVTGRELLRKYGLVGDDDNWGNFVAGLGVDILTDPLSYLSGPAKALTPAGQAAKKAGLLDNAATAATRKAIDTGLDDALLPAVARRNRTALEATRRNLSTFDPATVGRPLFGPRTAQRASSLDDLIKYADGGAAGQAKAEESLRRILGDSEFEAIRAQKGLSKSFGLGLPFQDPSIVGDFLGAGFGDKYADALDTLGSGLRWSPLGRQAHAMFNGKVGGALDAEQQITNIADFNARQRLGGIATGAHTYHLSKVAAQHPEVFQGEEANRALGRYIEGTAEAADRAYVESRPALKEYADWWINNRQDYIKESKIAGLSAGEMKDAYGIDYLPRHAETILQLAGKRNRKLASALSHMTGDMMGRTDAMQVPGGRDTIIDLSRDTFISGAKRTAQSDDEAAKYVMDFLNAKVQAGQPKVGYDQALKIARVMNTLPDEVVQKSPLFGQHPMEMIGGYMRGRNEAIATANTLYDSLATMARDRPYTDVLGGRHISLAEAIERLGLKTYDDATFDIIDDFGGSGRPLRGAAQQMRERLAKVFKIADPDSIKLSEFSVPEEHVNRLLRGRDAFETGEAAKSLLDHLDWYTQAWRGSILTWPSRAVRDQYSGALSNWLEGASSLSSIRAAKALIQEGPESPVFQKVLKSISRYDDGNGLAQFYADLAETGLIQATQFTAPGASVIGKGALSNLPGHTPITIKSILSELAPKPSRTWREFASDFGTWKSELNPLAETKNPILLAGEQTNALTDSINRISGYIALMEKGYEPLAAARAMKRAHVDYTSLTTFEKAWLKRLFPWYSYQSRIFQEVLRQLIEQPGGRYGQLMRATEAVQGEGDDTYTPSGIRSQFAFPIPAEWGGRPSPQTQTYLTDLDFPGFDQLNMIETPGTWSGTAAGTGRQIAMQLHPILRSGVELAVGQDLFTNRPLGESTSPLDAILRSVSGDQNADVPFLVDKAAEIMPFAGRPLYAARGLLDTRGDRPLWERVRNTSVNALSGVKLRDVAQEDVLSDAARQIEQSIDPYTREFKQVFIPEHLQPQVPEWAMRRLAVSRALGREKREIRGGRKKSRKRKSDTGASSLFE